MNWNVGVDMLRMDPHTSVDVPSLDEVQEKVHHKYVSTAYCSSMGCTRSIRNLSRYGVKKTGIPVTEKECPDCGHALFWMTEKTK